MKTTYRFIKFVSHPNSPGSWLCQSRKFQDVLGTVYWYVPWKQYVFSAEETAEFSADCLRDIAAFLEEAGKERGGGKRRAD